MCVCNQLQSLVIALQGFILPGGHKEPPGYVHQMKL